jgi:hypothetical protein
LRVVYRDVVYSCTVGHVLKLGEHTLRRCCSGDEAVACEGDIGGRGKGRRLNVDAVQTGLVAHDDGHCSRAGGVSVFVEDEHSCVGPVVEVVDLDGQRSPWSHGGSDDPWQIVIDHNRQDQSVEKSAGVVVGSLSQDALERGIFDRTEEVHASALNHDPLYSKLNGPNGSSEGVGESVNSNIVVDQPQILEKDIIGHEVGDVVPSSSGEASLDVLHCVVLAEEVVDGQVTDVWEDHSSYCENAALVGDISHLVEPKRAGVFCDPGSLVVNVEILIHVGAIPLWREMIVARDHTRGVPSVGHISCFCKVRLSSFGTEGIIETFEHVFHVAGIKVGSSFIVPTHRQAVVVGGVPA